MWTLAAMRKWNANSAATTHIRTIPQKSRQASQNGAIRTMREHWHVRNNKTDADPFVTMSVYDALEYVVDELQTDRDIASQAATAYYEQQMYVQAAHHYKIRDELDDLIANAKHAPDQHNTTERNDRAPLFRNWHIDQQRGDWGEDSKLYQTALWHVSQVNEGSEIDIYACRADDVIADDQGNWHESYFPAGG